jgi:hypothetical protein
VTPVDVEDDMPEHISFQRDPKVGETKWTMLSVRLDPTLVRTLKVQSVLAQRSMRSIAEEALRDWINRNSRQF